MTSDPAIRITGLTKHYGDVEALTDLNLEIQAGEVFGFLGPNGAGKTTTIKMLLGFMPPSTGSLKVLGSDPVDPETLESTSNWEGLISSLLGSIGVVVWTVFTLRLSRLALSVLSKDTERFQVIEPVTLPLFENLGKVLIVGLDSSSSSIGGMNRSMTPARCRAALIARPSDRCDAGNRDAALRRYQRHRVLHPQRHADAVEP